jgi:RNA polymerase sigma factor (sigma-70 family)
LHGVPHASDGDLLSQFVKHNDDQAFAALVRRHSAMVWGVCRRVIGNHHDAEDAFQATFLVLARKAASVWPPNLVANWLHGVARRTALKARTMSAKRRLREKQVENMPEPVASAHASWAEVEALVDQELAALPEKYRIAVLLCDVEGKTGRVAARQLDIPEGTLAGRLRTARVLLAKRLARHGLVLSGGALATAISQNAASACAPPVLVSVAIKAATLVAAGKAPAAALVSARVTALSEGVLKAMCFAKLKSALTVFLIVAGLGGTAGLTYQMQPAAQSPTKAVEEPATETDAKSTARLRQARRDVETALDRLEQARAELERARAALTPSQGERPNVLPPADNLTAAPWATKLFKETSKDFGSCSGDEPLTYRFEITNIYSVPLLVINVRASAGCVTWELQRKELKPRESGYLEVRLDPRRFTGAKTVTLHVTVGPSYVSTATITLTANRLRQ